MQCILCPLCMFHVFVVGKQWWAGWVGVRHWAAATSMYCDNEPLSLFSNVPSVATQNWILLVQTAIWKLHRWRMIQKSCNAWSVINQNCKSSVVCWRLSFEAIFRDMLLLQKWSYKLCECGRRSSNCWGASLCKLVSTAEEVNLTVENLLCTNLFVPKNKLLNCWEASLYKFVKLKKLQRLSRSFSQAGSK